MTKREAEAYFRREILPEVRKTYERDGRRDLPARREAWNNYTDDLCKGCQITMRQYETWTHPSCCNED